MQTTRGATQDAHLLRGTGSKQAIDVKTGGCFRHCKTLVLLPGVLLVPNTFSRVRGGLERHLSVVGKLAGNLITAAGSVLFRPYSVQELERRKQSARVPNTGADTRVFCTIACA